jgi:hypothetical protein
MKTTSDNNFWDINRDLLVIDDFQKLYKADKSRGKEDSSKTMWGIYYVYNPDSALYNIPNKLEMIAKDFYKDPKFKWDKIENLVNLYKNSVLSDAERALVSWNEIMVMRDKAIKDLYKLAINDNDTDELVKIDKMLALTPKMFDDYKKVRKDFEEEKTTKKGKHIKSLTESGDI